MQREHKYRAKDIIDNEWYYGSLMIYNTAKCVEIVDNDTGCINTVVDETVGEYSGLKDMNKIEIYEGDILHHIWNSGSAIKETISEVKFKNGAFIVDDKKRNDFDLALHVNASYAAVDVIGNIHDNPELIEQEKSK